MMMGMGIPTSQSRTPRMICSSFGIAGVELSAADLVPASRDIFLPLWNTFSPHPLEEGRTVLEPWLRAPETDFAFTTQLGDGIMNSIIYLVGLVVVVLFVLSLLGLR